VIRGREVRRAEYPVDPVFLDRWSARAMSGESIADGELRTLLSAAAWAPSSHNAQPWRMLYAHRESPSWGAFFDLLSEGNKRWVQNAAALVLFVSKRTNEVTGAASRTHSFDTGAAWGYFAAARPARNRYPRRSGSEKGPAFGARSRRRSAKGPGP